MKILFLTAQTLNLAHFVAAALIRKLKHGHILSADQTVLEFISAKLQPSLPLNYYTVKPNSAVGKIRNRLTSSNPSLPASELVTDLQATLDLSVTKSSSTTAHPTTTVDEEEGSEEQAEGKGREDDFFDQAAFSDDQVDNDGWESGSIHSGDEGVPSRLRPLSTDSDSESEPGSDSASNAGSLRHSNPKTKSGVKLKAESLSGDDDRSTLNSDSDSNTLPPPSHLQKRVPKPSGGAGTSTFLPSLSVGYIPGTGDSDPEDELEAVEGKGDRKNRRGQRARRA